MTLIRLKIRGKSVETIEVSVLCPDDEETRTDVSLNTDDIECLVDANFSNEIELNDEFTVIMRYPTVQDTLSVSSVKSETEKAFFIIKNCIESIVVGEETYHRVDISNKELDEFFESMTNNMFEKLQQFFMNI